MSETHALILVLVVAALVLILLEICTPTFGILAGLALLCIIAAVWIAFSISTATGIIALIGVVILVPVYTVLLVKLLPRTPIGRRFFLAGPPPEQIAAALPEVDELQQYVGQAAVAETQLRPSGAIRVAGRRVIASAESGVIPRGAAVRILRVRGGELVVRPDSPEKP